MEDGRSSDDSSTELYCTTVGAGGSDRLRFLSTAGRMSAGFGQKQPEALFEPSQ